MHAGCGSGRGRGRGSSRKKRITYFHMLLTRFTAILMPHHVVVVVAVTVMRFMGVSWNDFTTFDGIVRCVHTKQGFLSFHFHFHFFFVYAKHIVNKSQSNGDNVERATCCMQHAQIACCGMWQPQVANIICHISYTMKLIAIQLKFQFSLEWVKKEGE